MPPSVQGRELLPPSSRGFLTRSGLLKESISYVLQPALPTEREQPLQVYLEMLLLSLVTE